MAARRARGGFDLHTHSTISDGTTRPSAIAQEAAGIGLAGFALTDHDTIDGWDEARDAAATAGIDFLPGIEITSEHDGRSRHLLGYGIDPGARAAELFGALDEVRRSRLHRAQEMVRRLARDYAISWADVVGDGDARTVGRPHIADALVTAGYFADRSTVFERVLHPGSPYYIGTYAIATLDAIRMVREAGGATVLAHPAATRQRGPVTDAELRRLAGAGLWGIELSHPENRESWLPPLERSAAAIGLEVTGASDYHGAGKANRLGERTTAEEAVARLRERLATPR
ncbi:phosphatase [Leucobacter sp. OLJS4]|uniref:PHP domain-containing protein n=1 Tax=unclassified Leucobacter TaxID=2621730 RepID=UPI000C1958CE|nr:MULTISPECIES: PHP domain-containing protein [unclassified Leucobacter]PII81756.1 phosphatase [Leucobacter sp. OLCALW19]PII86430.1 phosphatase [Leucobacter sp. OLTLW20]PII90325.1 phosphatase [Leucobacter sp. OLAS13]PII97358.1 phosphatase [Leucobacter sp. OLDS2]PIJ00875.1 phosphatase [Leucobacter sp. OLCS4]